MSQMGILTKFECPSCGNIIHKREVIVAQGKSLKFTQPSKCGCGRVGDFRLLGYTEQQVAIFDKDKTVYVLPNNLTDKEKEYLMGLMRRK